MIPKDRILGSLIVFFYFLSFILVSNVLFLKLILSIPIFLGIFIELFQNYKPFFLFYGNFMLYFFFSYEKKVPFLFYIFLTFNFTYLIVKSKIDKDLFLKILLFSLYISFLTFFVNLNQKEIIYLLSIVWSTDSFAYLIGKYFGKHKLTPISPKKTWEGAIGGVIFGALISSLIFFILFSNGINNISLENTFLIGIIFSILSQIGDLFASYIKRIFNIKDFSNIIPGHGGILDRLDSLLFVSPWIYLFFH